MEYVSVPGATRTLAPQAVVLLNPETGLPYAASGISPLTDAQLRSTPLPVREITADSLGAPFDLDACAHTYAYNAGLLVADTATSSAGIWVKTYGYTAGNLTSESKWVKQ